MTEVKPEAPPYSPPTGNVATGGGANVNVSYAPVTTQHTSVVIQQPIVGVRIGQRQNERPWSTGLCGCCEDCGSCLYAYCCYPYFLCSLATKMDEFYCGPHCFGGGGFCDGGGYCGATVYPNPFLVGMRSKLRGQYGIRGSVCCDTMTVWCCECCAATQMYRELKHWQNQ